MSQSLCQNYVHIIFHISFTDPVKIPLESEKGTHAYLAQICNKLNSPAIAINGMSDHVHILCRLSKNLAVADIGNCVLVLLPILLTQYGKLNGMLLFGSGDIFYKVVGSYINSFFVANIVLINILSLNKLLRCIYPLRNLYTTRSQRIKVTALTISLSIVPAFWHINRFSKGFETLNEVWRDLDYLGGRHVAEPKHDDTDRNEIITDILYYLYIAIPSLTLIIFNSSLVVFAIQKSNNAINKKNLLIVVIVTAGFFISFIPELVSTHSPSYSAEYREFSFSLLWLSCWTNPFIYLAVNPSFREFTKKRLLCRRATVEQVPLGRVVNNTINIDIASTGC